MFSHTNLPVTLIILTSPFKQFACSNAYSTITGFDFDMRYYSSFYLYIKLFETSTYTKEFMETEINIDFGGDPFDIKTLKKIFINRKHKEDILSFRWPKEEEIER